MVKNQQGLRGARRLFACQLAVTVLAAVVVLLRSGTLAGWSVVLGGVVAALPTAFFAKTVFKHQGALTAKQIAGSFYKGEALKISFTVVLFTLVFRWVNIVPLLFFAAYIGVQLMIWFAPLLFVNQENRPQSD